MPIFTAIATAISAALFAGSAFATSIIAAGLAFGARLLVGYLNRPKKRKYTAVQGTVQLGADVPASTVYGTTKVKGHRIGYFKYGSGNKWNADVFVLANGWCDGLEPEIYFYGEKHTLVARTKVGGEIEHWGIDGFDDLVSIRFYDGRPVQGVDQKLVDDTASLGRKWKATSLVAGCAYVVVERKYDSDKFAKGRPEFDFILRGLREYDPRKDSTYPGSSGTQRVDDASTWVHTENPAIHRLNYLLGVKGLVSGRTLIGVGKSLAGIDVDSHIAAANVADTLRPNGKPTYRCSIFVQGDDVHTEILKEFEDALAGYGMNRAGLSGVIAGAPQIPVATITGKDIRTDEGQQISLRKSAFDLYNVISGQFTSKESNWEAESLKTVTVNADVTADKHKRQTSNDFLQVTDPDIAQYLLNIRYRQNRKGGSATLPVSRRIGIKCDVGTWVSYMGRTWLVMGRQWSAVLKCTLSLAETGSDVYSEDGIEPGPIVIPPVTPVNPSLLSTVQNFRAAAGFITGATGYDVPALTFTWDPPEDPSITAVRFFYQVDPDDGGDGTIYEDQTTDVESGTYTTTKNVLSGKVYDARATISTRPDRLHTYTPWVTTAQATGLWTGVIDLDQLAEDVKGYQEFVGQGLRAFQRQLLALATNVADQDLGNFSDKQTLRRELVSTRDNITASYTEAIVVATGPGSALVARIEDLEVYVDDTVATAIDSLSAQITTVDGKTTANADAITALSATVDDVSASVTVRGSVTAAPTGWTSRYAVEVRGGVGEDWSSAAFYLDAKPGLSRAVFVADQFIITDGANDAAPFVFTGGEAVMQNARIGTVTFDQLSSSNGNLLLKGSGSNASIEVFT